jgi:4-oxalocrotonate tautomerase family enzyme
LQFCKSTIFWYNDFEKDKEEVMPLVKIEIIKGKSLEYKKTVLDAVHVALENAIQIENWDRFQRLYEIEDELFERSESKTDKFTMIEITMFPGRTKEQKSKLYKEIVKELNQRLGIEPTDIFIVINEPANENWGLAGIQREG